MSDKYPGGLVTAAAPAGYSVAFDGSGDFLSLASNAAFTVGTGNVTIEAWIYVTSLSQAYQGIISGRADVSPNFPGLGLTIDNSQLNQLLVRDCPFSIFRFQTFFQGYQTQS